MVCLGNICRSPTAEGVFRAQAKTLGYTLEVASAGTENYHVGDPPDPRTITHAQRRGYDLSELRARHLAATDFAYFDLILAADADNLREMQRRCPPPYHYKLGLLLGTAALPDPYYGGADGFEKVLDLVEKRAAFLLANWCQDNC